MNKRRGHRKEVHPGQRLPVRVRARTELVARTRRRLGGPMQLGPAGNTRSRRSQATRPREAALRPDQECQPPPLRRSMGPTPWPSSGGYAVITGGPGRVLRVVTWGKWSSAGPVRSYAVRRSVRPVYKSLTKWRDDAVAKRRPLSRLFLKDHSRIGVVPHWRDERRNRREWETTTDTRGKHTCGS